MFMATGVLTVMNLVAQETPAPAKPQVKPEIKREAVIIPVKTLSGDSFNRLAKMLNVFGVHYVADDQLRTILVYANPDVVAQMRRVVEELDRPGSEAAIGRNIEMTMAFLRCSTKPQSEPGTLPADLEPAARQLRTATQYKHIELWDIVPIRMQEGKGTRQILRLPTTLPDAPGAIATAELDIRPEAVTRKESSRYVRFDYLRIGFRIPYITSPKNEGATPSLPAQYGFIDLRLNTSGDFKEGQKAILGKLSGMEEGTATFVVISLKVLD
jgi:hypothetical protein